MKDALGGAFIRCEHRSSAIAMYKMRCIDHDREESGQGCENTCVWCPRVPVFQSRKLEFNRGRQTTEVPKRMKHIVLNLMGAPYRSMEIVRPRNNVPTSV